MALALLAPGIAAALGVGDYELNSYLNQPLDMRVKLSDTGELAQDEILVELAADKDYESAGVQRSQLHSRLNFEVELDENAQTGTLHISTDKPVREPYINFLSEVLWPTGRMLREFTVLLDPPSQQQQQAQPAQPETPDTQTDQQQQQDQQAATADQESVSQPVEPREPAEATRSEAESRTPVAEAPAPKDRETYTVKQQDTMWQVALDHRPDSSVSVQQMLSALQRLNQDAFIDGNVNLVREGAVLRIPSQQEIRAINTRKAMQDLASQNRKWREMLRARGIDPDSAPLQGTPSPGEGERQGTGEGEVQLVTESGESSTEGSGAGGEGSADSQQLENQLAIREEKLDRLERENEELSSRLDDLEEQVQTSDQLLQLREEKIAQLQQELKRLSENEGVDVARDLMEPVEQPGAADTADAGDDAGAEQASGEGPGADESEGTGDGEGEQTADAQAQADETAEGEDAAGTTEQEPAADGEKTADAQADGTDQAADGADETAAETAPAERADQQGPAAGEPAEQPSLVEKILDFILGNLVMIGAALVGLIALVVAAVLLLRRGGHQDLPEGTMVEADEDDDFLPAGLMDDDEDDFGAGGDDQGGREAPASEGQDPLEEADLYVVYGRHQQAVDYLRGEIDKAPERNDLKIRQLDILAEMNDSDAFEKEAANLAGTDPEVDSHIDTLRGKLGSGEAASEEPSLDDLEMDLSSGLDEGGSAPQASPSEQTAQAGSAEEDLESLDDFGDFDFSLDEGSDTESSADADSEDLEFDLGSESGEGEEDNSIDFSPASGGDTGGEGTLDTGETDSESEGGDEPGDLEFSLDDLDTGEDSGEEDLLDIGEDTEAPATGTPTWDDSAPAGSRSDEQAASEAEPALELDDSFDFELDSGEEDDTALSLDEDNVSSEFSEASEESASDDLDLSLDDLDTGDGEAGGEDLDAALGELDTGSETPGEPESDGGDDSAELELDLDEADTSDDAASAPEPEPAAPEPEPAAPEPSAEPSPEPASGGESGAESEAMGADDLLSDDDDFDFLGDSDENATKLDLAKAYIDMGDNEGARDILNEVLSEGTEGQQGEARELLSQVG